MNAVNLLPPDLRRGSGAPARSGIAVYAVLGALALAVVLVAATTMLKGRVADRESDLARVEAEATAAEQNARSVSHYKALAEQTSTRVEGVRKVARGRIDWSETLTQISQTVGTQVAFTSLNATTSGSGGGGGNPLRSAIASPAVEIIGCARDHAAVARLMARFRAMDDVQRVSLSDSEKSGGSSSPSPADAASGESAGCGGTSKLAAQFNIVVFLDQDETQTPVTQTSSTGGAR